MSTSKTVPARTPARQPGSTTEAATCTDAVALGKELQGHQNRKTAKRPKPLYTKFKRLENRQKAVEQNRRAVYAHLDEITRENIKLAKKGNSAIAKFLFEFAGINQVPALVKASAKTKKNATGGEGKTEEDPTNAVLSFYKKLGMTPPKLKPPKAAEAAESAADEQEAAIS